MPNTDEGNDTAKHGSEVLPKSMFASLSFSQDVVRNLLHVEV